MRDGRDKESGPRSDQKLIVRSPILPIADFLPLNIDFIHRLAGDMGDIVFLEKVRIHKIDALGIPFMAQIFVKHTAGMHFFVGGNHGDRILRADITKHLGGADTGGAGSNDNKSLHTHTSLTSMACLGQARTQAGPSSKWAQKSHLIIRFRSGEMAGTP